MKASDILVVAGKYKVAAFRKADGVPIWSTELVSRFWKGGGPFVTLLVDETTVYAHVIKELFCLDLQTGKILWQQQVPDLGTEVASMAIAGVGGSSLPTARGRLELEKKRSDAASSDVGSSTT